MSLGAQTFLVVNDDSLTESTIRAALPATTSMRFVSLRDALDSAAELVTDSAPSVVLVNCSSNAEWGLRVIGDMAGVQPSRPIIALYNGNPNGFMDPAFRAGADDLIVLPQPPEQLAFELQKIVSRRRGGPGVERKGGALITVLGPKGGTGKTVTSTNLAVALADSGAKPLIIDVDLQFGDVGLALGLKPERTIYDLVQTGGSLDGEKIEGFAIKHFSGASALLAPTRPDQAAVITTNFLRDLFTVARRTYDFVIVDTAPAFSPEVIVAIDAATHLCLVGMLDALSLKDTKIGLETLKQMGYSSDDVTLVLNRADTSVGISMSDVYSLLKKDPDVLVPSDRAIPRALTVGETIYEADPKSGAGRAYEALAQHYLNLARADELAAGFETPELADTGQGGVLRRRRLLRRGN
jgi:pilus assembly protein CpaE